MAGDIVSLRPQTFDESARRPALEGESAGFDALDQWRARDHGFVGFAHVAIGAFDAAVKDCGGLPFVLAER